MERMKLGKERLGDFFARLGNKQIYAPQRVGETLRFALVAPEDELDLEFSNTTVPPKSVLFPQTETLYRYDLGSTDLNLPEEEVERVLFGVRPCDARAMAIVDHLFSWDFDDPYYLAKREKTTVIGLACLEPEVNCFCTSVGGGPASTEGLDLLFTDLGEAFLLQPLTEKGEKICQEAKEALEQATGEEGASAEKLQQAAAEKIVRGVETNGIAEKLPKVWESPLWQDVSEACLGCGTCTFLCPTCYCFDIQDEAEGLEGRRCRVWDSCMFSEYTLHASGHNPRPTVRERTRNRVNHKYSYFVEKFGIIACVGCGRCINLCPVNIDILNILAEVIKEEAI